MDIQTIVCQMEIWKTLLAALPILIIFAAMLIFKLSSWKASALAFLSACLLAVLVWKMSWPHLGQAFAEGALTALMPIVWVIFTATFLYNLSVQSGAIHKIRGMLQAYAADEPSLVILIAFGFGSFLESVSGYGTPVVVPIAMLISLGFAPLRAAVICLVANTVAVAFGVIGIPTITLAQITALPIGEISLAVTLQLFLFAMLLPWLLVLITLGNFKATTKYIPLCLLTGFTFALVQTVMAWLVGPELPATVASLCSMLVTVIWHQAKNRRSKREQVSFLDFAKPWSAYLIILFLVLATRLLKGLAFLSQAPFVLKLNIYEGKPPFSAALLTTPGSIILISSIAFSIIYRIPTKAFFISVYQTIRQIKTAVLTVVLIVASAKIMAYSTMIDDIARGLANVSGVFFPLISPLIGCLGTFITGSDTSSNILFGILQKQTAILIGENPVWIAAANASGATVGKMISPISLALAASTAGIKGCETEVLRQTLKYAAILILMMSLLIYLTSLWV